MTDEARSSTDPDNAKIADAGRSSADAEGRTPASADAAERQLVSALKDTVARLKRQIADQQDRIESLARGREEGMAMIGRLRDELSLVSAERDRLRKNLLDMENMQTETLAFDDKRDLTADTGLHEGGQPSIDELISGLSGKNEALSASHSTKKVESGRGAADYQEMISPELLVLGSSGEKGAAPEERCLILLGPEETKCALNDDLVTIGRSESADIQIEGDFISRIHSRVLHIGRDTIIEDAGSRNGTWVDNRKIDRHVLRHGNLVRIGSASFRYVDTAGISK